jgi:hypothetical protein
LTVAQKARGLLDRLVVLDPDIDLAGRGRGDEGEAGAVGVDAAGGGRLGLAAERPRHLQEGVGVVVVEVLDRARGALADGIVWLH